MTHRPFRGFLDPYSRKHWAVPLKYSDEQVFFGRCFHDRRVFLSCGGASPSVLASFLGLMQPLPGAARLGGGVGLQQARYSKELFKAAGSSPLLFTALPGGSCHRHAPTGATGTQQPSAPTQRRGGGSLCTLLAGGPAAPKAGPIRQQWTLDSPPLPAHAPVHSPSQ